MLAKAECQPASILLTHRFREQARSHRGNPAQSYDDTPVHPSPPSANPLTYLLTVLPLRSYKGVRCTTTYNNGSTHNKSKKDGEVMKVKGIRWWMVGLVTAGLMVNYLARNTLSVAAPTLMSEMNISTEQYSHIVVAWQVCYALMQPVAGYIIDAIGTKMGFAIFAFAWSIACALAALATGWQGLAFVRGLLGLTEAAGLPAAVKTSTEWFPAKERSVAIGWFNIGSSIGAVLAPPLVVWAILHSGWELAFLIVGGLGVLWSFLWVILYKHPRDPVSYTHLTLPTICSV